MTYVSGKIELRHPPVFLKAALPVVQRTILEDFHLSPLEQRLTAGVPAGVKLGKLPAHMTLLEEIFKAKNGANYDLPSSEGHKKLSFDKKYTFILAFYSRCLATFSTEATLRIQMATIELVDTTRNPVRPAHGTFTGAQLKH
ncbi:hypothetical protein PC129_g16377 [Phytophthora cactorum]|uniref:Uncharacterized protein n=1 Tax=Phytophthora cactorum TaxID=29920 RepID=A0A8T1L1D7_9STRA|nr:hypothetical protein PC113_g7483 [Phytophthora cactorum]KAG2875308.1 hypothetical protein PC114_g24798 [Phytophthora cactorum]KAG2929120.1 hypothetical protein PC115_g6986 [Phytophthora cactorum]KAG2945638.1 hypothetical protein PC117_g8305 [Phytophthora cactorum]KAG2985408.1 hypothetical protein PC120_g24061 [Phytophthora cactorum]